MTSLPIDPSIVDYYLGLLAGVIPAHARARLSLVSAHDGSARPLSAKLIERPRLIERIRDLIPDLDGLLHLSHRSPGFVLSRTLAAARLLRQVHGASYLQLLDLSDWDRGLATSTPGQSGQPGSPHYGDLLPLWAEGKYFPLAYSRAKVEEVTLHRLRLTPR